MKILSTTCRPSNQGSQGPLKCPVNIWQTNETNPHTLFLFFLPFSLYWHIREPGDSLCKHHPFIQRGVSIKITLLLCVWKHICEKSLRHTWPGRSHWNLIIKLVMEPERDVNWFEKNPDFTWQALLTCYVTPKSMRCAGNDELSPRGEKEALIGPASKSAPHRWCPVLSFFSVFTFQRWMLGWHLSTQECFDTWKAGTSKLARCFVTT